MNRRQRALARRYERDPEFRHQLDRAGSPEEALAVAEAFGVRLERADVAPADDELSDVELDAGAGGVTAADGLCWGASFVPPYCPGDRAGE